MTIVAAVAAVLALGAVASASASARAPEFELREGKSFPIKFSDTNHAAPTFETPGGESIKCKEENVEGEITGATTVANVVETLNGCKSNIVGGGTCHNAGTETIKTASLKGTLGYISEATKQVGLELEGETTGSGGAPLWGEFSCKIPGLGNSPMLVEGHVFSTIEAEHQAFKENLTLSYAQTKGVQKISHFEGGSEQQLQLTYVLGSEKLGVSAESVLGMSAGEEIAVREMALGFKLISKTFPMKFSGTTGTPIIETAKGWYIECKGVVTEGEITGTNAIGKVVETLKECSTNLFEGHPKCKNVGTETIQSVPLKGSLGYINKVTEKVGLRLEPETGSRLGPWAEFTCGGNSVVVYGRLVGLVNQELGRKTPHIDLAYRQKMGTQEILGFEGGGTEEQLWMESARGREPLGVATEPELKMPAGEEIEIY